MKKQQYCECAEHSNLAPNTNSREKPPKKGKELSGGGVSRKARPDKVGSGLGEFLQTPQIEEGCRGEAGDNTKFDGQVSERRKKTLRKENLVKGD